MSKLTQDKIDSMEISNAVFRNGSWSVLVMDAQKIGYRLFFEGSELDTDEDIINKVTEILLETEEKSNDYSKVVKQPPIVRESAKGKKIK